MKKISREQFGKFHKEFKGDNLEIFEICSKCGGKCEYGKIGTLLPGEKEFMAQEMGLTVEEFTDKYLDVIVNNNEKLDVLKLVEPCPFLNDKNECTCREIKVILCEIYPIIFDIKGNEVMYFLDKECPLTHIKKFRDYFESVGINALINLNIPLNWLKLVEQYDHLNFDYDKLQTLRESNARCEQFDLKTVIKIGAKNQPSNSSTKEYCFVIMPLHEDFADIYYRGIKESVIKKGFECKRADEQKHPGIVTDKIISDILNASFIIADISSQWLNDITKPQPNPNVMYELGVAHSFNKTVILLSQDLYFHKKIPFDISNVEIIGYEYNPAYSEKQKKSCLKRLKEELEKYIDSVLEAEYVIRNPVSGMLEGKTIYVSDLYEWLWGYWCVYSEEKNAKTVWVFTKTLYWYDVDETYRKMVIDGIINGKRKYYLIIPNEKKLIDQKNMFLNALKEIEKNKKIDEFIKFLTVDSKYFDFFISELVIYDAQSSIRRGYISEPMCYTVGLNGYDKKMQTRNDEKRLYPTDLLDEKTFDVRLDKRQVTELASSFKNLWNEKLDDEFKNITDDMVKRYVEHHWKIS